MIPPQEALHLVCVHVLCALQVMGTPSSQLSTGLLEDPHNVARYAAFLVARQVANTTLSNRVSEIRKVLAWRASAAETVSQQQRLQAVLKWVDFLHRQCPNVSLPSPALHNRTNLPTASQVIGWQLKVEAHARQLLTEDTELHGKMYRSDTCRAAQDAAMLALSFGYLPPLRLSCIRTCVHPDFVASSGGCCESSCR